MKTFEHEVLGFDARTRKGQEEMREALREWGAAGYEHVSVTADTTIPQGYFLFFKREVIEGGTSEKAA